LSPYNKKELASINEDELFCPWYHLGSLAPHEASLAPQEAELPGAAR
jgi:hypothetical protein